ncbi:hypothetical protein [Rhizobium sp.]
MRARHNPLSENCRASGAAAVWRVHSGVLDCFSQKPGIHEIPRMIFVFDADFVVFTGFSTFSIARAGIAAEKMEKTAKNMAAILKILRFLPALNIAIP